MKIYISGPIDSETGVSREEKLERFTLAENYLKSEGYEVVNPLKVSACDDMSCDPGQLSGPPPGLHTWACYLKHDLIAMLECEAIAMLPQWIISKGASLEHRTAIDLHYTVFYLNENGELEL